MIIFLRQNIEGNWNLLKQTQCEKKIKMKSNEGKHGLDQTHLF